jgi:hypothetical protein
LTSSQDFLDYLQVQWNIADPAVADIHWTQEWFDWKNQRAAQIVVSPMWSFRQETWNTGGSFDMRANSVFAINIGYFIPRGAVGTVRAQSVENMKKEVVRIIKEGMSMGTNKFGGSLAPLRIAIPDGHGRRLNELDRTPRLLRTELLMRCTEDM